MSSRLYDYIITVDNLSQFTEGNNIIGLSSGSSGLITKIEPLKNSLKVKMSNAYQEFEVGESIVSNHSPITQIQAYNSFTVANSNVLGFTLDSNVIPEYLTGYSDPITGDDVRELNIYVDGAYKHPTDWYYESSTSSIKFYDYAAPGESILVVRKDRGNVSSQSFTASNLSIGSSISTVSSNIISITNSTFIRSINEFTQAPIVRLISVYYPGEWYPSLDSGNPGGAGSGYAWPTNFPWRIAEIVGDIHSDISYNVTFDGDSYIPYPVETDGISTSSDGTIDTVNIRVSNYDNLITSLIEDPRLVGNVTSNSATGYVNGELVVGLDPETVIGNIHYNQSTVDSYYGKANSPWIYSQAQARGETWNPLKYDTRDLLGAVVEIKSTFANHLQYWPEYSKISFVNSNVITVINSAPYRVGDTVTTATTGDGWGLSTFEYLANLDVSAQQGFSSGIDFKSDGSYMYLSGFSGGRIEEYELSIPWYIQSASHVRGTSFSSEDTAPRGVVLSSDYSNLYIAGSVTDAIYQYSLSESGNTATASLLSSFSVSSELTNLPTDIRFSPEGRQMYVLGLPANLIQYTLSTDWDISTASYNTSFSLTSTETSPRGVSFKSDGTKFYISGATGIDITEFNLSEAWNVASATFSSNVSIPPIDQSTDMKFIYISPTGESMFVGGLSTDKIYQYNLSADNIVIQDIVGNDLYLSKELPSISLNDNLFIINDNYDTESYIKDVFKITELNSLNEQFAEFTLTNWLQYFKLQLPKRKYYKNTCQWQYKGAECQYPGPNGGTIPGTFPPLQANTNPITITNEIGSLDEDECSKSYLACKLRNNIIHFGGFIGTGRSISK